MLELGKMVKEMDMVYNIGQKEHFMKENGKMTKEMV